MKINVDYICNLWLIYKSKKVKMEGKLNEIKKCTWF